MDDWSHLMTFTDAAIKRMQILFAKKDNQNSKLRVYVTGGGCSGFQYGFTIDESINNDDIIIQQKGVSLVIDQISLQYLVGGLIDYIENLEGARFVVINPKMKTTCGCGYSFSI